MNALSRLWRMPFVRAMAGAFAGLAAAAACVPLQLLLYAWMLPDPAIPVAEWARAGFAVAVIAGLAALPLAIPAGLLILLSFNRLPWYRHRVAAAAGALVAGLCSLGLWLGELLPPALLPGVLLSGAVGGYIAGRVGVSRASAAGVSAPRPSSPPPPPPPGPPSPR